jgi:hypothetical protein
MPNHPWAIPLCKHIKDDGKVCRSPAMRKQSYCFFHLEQRRRQKRMAEVQLIAKLRKKDVPSETERLAERILKSWIFKNLTSKCFADGYFEDILAINREVSLICDRKGEGVSNQQFES